MKGIITDYFEEKGFGFLKDENEEKRFFHISNIKERKKFLNNIEDYLYTDWVERKCYVVKFNPNRTEKGLNALNICLTNQIFNDKSSDIVFEAKITDVEYYTDSLTRIVSGIKKGMSIPPGVTTGGNGTYRLGYPEVLRELNIHLRRIDDIGWGTIDVREEVLQINDRSKITDKLVATLKEKLVDKTVKVHSKHGHWILQNNSILNI